MLEKKSSIITKVIIGISIISLFIMPISVSADNSVTLLDWGWAYRESNNGISGYNVVNGSTLKSSASVFSYFGIPVKQDYTYTYTHTFNITQNYTSSIKANSKLYYTINLAPAGTFGQFTGNTDKALITLTYNGTTNGGYSYTLKVVFNSTTCGLPLSDVYLFPQIDKDYGTITIGNEVISCYYDPGATGYQQEIVDSIAAMKNQDTEYYSNALAVLDNIKSGVDGANTKLDGMPQKIEDVLDKQANEEKTEANNKGTDVVDQATEALKNVIPYSSLLDAIQPIKQAASYTGTVSVWTLPSITIPKITGVMEETEIMEEKSFDLVSYADQYIPDTLLSVIRAVNTCGLILFAVYEVIRLVLWVVSNDSEGGGLFK